MNLHFIFLIVIMFSISCGERTIKEKDNFSWGEIPNQLKDSLIYMEKSGHIPNSISGVAAKESENYSKLVWILNNSKTEYLEKLFYEHPSGVIKGIAAKVEKYGYSGFSTSNQYDCIFNCMTLMLKTSEIHYRLWTRS